MIQYLQHRFALSETGAKDMIKGFIACTLHNIALMFPSVLLYSLIQNLISGIKPNPTFYIFGSVICLLLIFITAFAQYNATYFATYIESGVRRISIAEKLRKLPLSFFEKKDLSDLTSTIMADCARIETASSHWICKLAGALTSTFLIASSLLFIDWKLALAALWPLPLAFSIVLFSSNIQV